MAIYQICSVKDLVADQYGRPFFTVSQGSAIRGFSDEVNRQSESMLYQHPNDFQLFFLGVFNDETCEFVLEATPGLLASGSQLAVRADGLAAAGSSPSEALIADLSPATAERIRSMNGARNG